MKICIFGAGAIGGYMGAKLAAAGADVSLVARGPHLRAMQERAYAKRGEQYLLIKSPPASGKSRALMFIALDKIQNQGLQGQGCPGR